MASSRANRRPLLLAATLGCLLTIVGAAHGRFGFDGKAPTGLDEIFAAAEATFARDASVDGIDLQDGRSRVPARWQAHFETFAEADRARPFASGGTVFVGSSSIDYWRDLPAQFPTHDVIQRGLAGATMADCAQHVDRLILPQRPRVVVVYAGDNDLAGGIGPERVVADYDDLVRRVHRTLPAARLVFVSIKPSPARVGLMPLIRRTNALMAGYARTDPRLDFVDIFPSMLGRDERPRPELFVADGVHLTSTGYALWRDAIAAHLD